MSSQSENKPWLDENGKLVSDETLKKISKTWDANIWELFLQQTVDIERSPNEVQMHGYEKLLEEVSHGIRWPSCSVPQHVVRQINLAVKALAPQQKKIIELIFWKSMSERQVAEKLKIFQPNVNDSKKISLNKIKEFLEKDHITCSYLIGGNENLTPRKRSRDEQVKQVYAKDLNGSYIK